MGRRTKWGPPRASSLGRLLATLSARSTITSTARFAFAAACLWTIHVGGVDHLRVGVVGVPPHSFFNNLFASGRAQVEEAIKGEKVLDWLPERVMYEIAEIGIDAALDLEVCARVCVCVRECECVRGVVVGCVWLNESGFLPLPFPIFWPVDARPFLSLQLQFDATFLFTPDYFFEELHGLADSAYVIFSFNSCMHVCG